MIRGGGELPPPAVESRATIGCARKPAALSLATGIGCWAAGPAAGSAASAGDGGPRVSAGCRGWGCQRQRHRGSWPASGPANGRAAPGMARRRGGGRWLTACAPPTPRAAARGPDSRPLSPEPRGVRGTGGDGRVCVRRMGKGVCVWGGFCSKCVDLNESCCW